MEIGKRNPYLYNKQAASSSSSAHYYDMGINQYNDGKKKEAEISFTKAIEIEKDDCYAYYNRGTFYLLEKRFKPAIDDFIRAIRLKPRFPEAMYNIACAYVQILSFREGLHYLKKAITYDKRYAKLAKMDPDFDMIKFRKDFEDTTMVV